MATPKHPGFKAVEAKVAQEPGITDPGAVVAAAARNASPAAKAANPNLKKVKGGPKKGKDFGFTK